MSQKCVLQAADRKRHQHWRFVSNMVGHKEKLQPVVTKKVKLLSTHRTNVVCCLEKINSKYKQTETAWETQTYWNWETAMWTVVAYATEIWC
jgi:hypothetical protein